MISLLTCSGSVGNPTQEKLNWKQRKPCAATASSVSLSVRREKVFAKMPRFTMSYGSAHVGQFDWLAHFDAPRDCHERTHGRDAVVDRGAVLLLTLQNRVGEAFNLELIG